MNDTLKQKTFRKEEAAAYLGISLSTFNRLQKAGKISAVIPVNALQYSQEELDKIKSTNRDNK